MILNDKKIEHADMSYYSDSCLSDNIYTSFLTSALEDELTFRLSSISDFEIDETRKEIHLTWKYLEYAERFLYKINISKPIPKFIISRSDIPDKLGEAITCLDSDTINKILTNAVRRILESVNPRYYHMNGIHGKVLWRFTD